jgi:hypothetical protein
LPKVKPILEFHIPFAPAKIPKLENEEISFIQADGHELDFILANFTNLPYPKGRRVVRWYGETARFIYQNLR